MGTLKNSRRLLTLGGLAFAGLFFSILPRASAITIPGGGGAIKSSPVAFGGNVYFGNGIGQVLCRNTSTGAAVWTFNARATGNGSLTSVVLGRPAITYIESTYLLFFTTNDGYVFCVNATTGAKVWGAGPLLAGATLVDTAPAVVTSSTLANTVVYVSAFTNSVGQVYALNGATGAALGNSADLITTNVAGNRLSSPAAYAAGVFVGVTGGVSAGVRLSTNLSTTLTALGTGYNSGASPFVYQHAGVGDPRVLVTTTNGRLCGFNVSTGSQQYDVVVATGVLLTSPVAYNNRVYMAGATNGIVYHANTVDGASPTGLPAGYVFHKPSPAKDILGGVTIDPAGIGAAPTVLFGNAQGRFYKVPIANPAGATYVQAPGPTSNFATTPSIDTTNAVDIIGNDDGNLYTYPRG